jgi:hypothetical protein
MNETVSIYEIYILDPGMTTTSLCHPEVAIIQAYFISDLFYLNSSGG